MASYIKAQIAPVNLGHIEIEGLLGDDSRFYVAAPQISVRFNFSDPQKNLSRDLKALVGKDFQTLKAVTPLNPKAVNVVTLDQFHRILIELGFKGNVLAQEVLRDLSALGLHQLFCDAFGIQLDAEDRAAWLQLRMESKNLFWELTGQIKLWLQDRECSAPEFTYYSNAFDCLNLQLFGKKSKAIRQELSIETPDALNRNHFGSKALRNIGIVQSGAARMISKEQVKPTDAIKHIVSVNYIDLIDYRE